MKVQVVISVQSAGEEETTKQRELELPAAVQVACKDADGTPTIVAIEFTEEGLKAKVVNLEHDDESSRRKSEVGEHANGQDSSACELTHREYVCHKIHGHGGPCSWKGLDELEDANIADLGAIPKIDAKPAKYLGVDMETTGLDSTKDRIVELAWIVLDEDLVEIDRAEYRLQVNSDVLLHCAAREMHLETGLIGYVDGLPVVLTSLGGSPGASPCALSEVEAVLTRVLCRFPDAPILAGQSVHFDRAFLQHWMPDAASMLHHRHFDARTVLLLRPDYWGWPQPSTPHRAMPDLLASIETLRIAKRFRSAE